MSLIYFIFYFLSYRSYQALFNQQAVYTTNFSIVWNTQFCSLGLDSPLESIHQNLYQLLGSKDLGFMYLES